ncbi:MAG: DUF1559 domain-containing protein [Candidatus Anammoximicrobium sp.]|nr:DUF1559 domain-containing protein [Candidatus Anammoximicrobium sp.]
MAPRCQAAWWPKTRNSRGGAKAGPEHGSTLASSVVARIEEVISGTRLPNPNSSSWPLLPMTTNNTVPAADETLLPGLRFRLIHVFYAMTLLGAALATFGAAGLPLAVPILGFWASVFFSRSRPRALARGCLVVLICFCLISLLLPAVQTARESARRAQCANNLKQLAYALHNYHSDHGVFPPAFVPDRDGRPTHSWRVLLLPYVEEKSRYDKYNFNEPWDGPNNSRLLNPVPWVYACPSDRRAVRGTSLWTSYVAVVGPRTAWPGASARKMSEITDGTASTILVMEDQSTNIPWMDPRDLTLDEALGILTSPDRQFASPHRREDFFYEYSGGRYVATADGRVSYQFYGLPRDVWSALLTIDDGVATSELDWTVGADDWKRPKVGNFYRLAVFVLLTLLPLPWVWRKPKPAEMQAQDIDA